MTSNKQYTWRCPSNIALVKYWGKWGRQYPKNASVSFTLTNAYTETKLAYQAIEKGEQGGKLTAFLFEGQTQTAFSTKVQTFLDSLTNEFPFIDKYNWHIETKNSFPHSSGIASSASAMGALALCLCSVERDILGTLQNEADFLQKASIVARLGSGSACRSVYPQAAIWGSCSQIASSNEYAIPFDAQLHNNMRNYQDTILIVSRAEKKVSSRAGHALMDNNIFAEMRYKQANQRLEDMIQVLQNGDLTQFIAITEAEALSLHALMMTSTPSYILMRPNTLHIIEKIRDFRNDTQLPICFTLDAGPNVHILYPKEHSPQIKAFIKNELMQYCENDYYIDDQIGNGATKLA